MQQTGCADDDTSMDLCNHAGPLADSCICECPLSCRGYVIVLNMQQFLPCGGHRRHQLMLSHCYTTAWSYSIGFHVVVSMVSLVTSCLQQTVTAGWGCQKPSCIEQTSCAHVGHDSWWKVKLDCSYFQSLTPSVLWVIRDLPWIRRTSDITDIFWMLHRSLL